MVSPVFAKVRRTEKIIFDLQFDRCGQSAIYLLFFHENG